MTLSAEKKTAAAMEASGKSAREIAEVVDKTPATVRGWRKDEEYLKELDEQGAKVSEELAPLIASVRRNMLEAADEARATLLEALNATTKDGRPSWGVRVAAAQTLLNQPLRVGIGAQAAEGEENGGAPQTAVIVVQGSPDAQVPEKAREHADVIVDAGAS